jgi:hypothetical protein
VPQADAYLHTASERPRLALNILDDFARRTVHNLPFINVANEQHVVIDRTLEPSTANYTHRPVKTGAFPIGQLRIGHELI